MWFLLGASAMAGSIGVNFSAGTWPVAPTDAPGVAPGTNFNDADQSTGTNEPLVDGDGLPTSALLTYDCTGAYAGFNEPSTPNPATNTMYRAGLHGNDVGGEVTITITGIPYATYDLYVFASQDTTSTSDLSITDGTTTFHYSGDGQTNDTASALLPTTSTNPVSPTVGPAQYQLFVGSTSPIVSLSTTGSISNVLSNNVFGLHIVEIPPPQDTSPTGDTGLPQDTSTPTDTLDTSAPGTPTADTSSGGDTGVAGPTASPQDTAASPVQRRSMEEEGSGCGCSTSRRLGLVGLAWTARRRAR